MPKAGEVGYVRAIGEAGAAGALGKPFSADDCGRYLTDFGLILGVLPPPPARGLDLGVGPGWTSVFLALRGYHVVGQDLAPDMIALAERNKARYGAETVEFAVGDYEGMGYRDEFDFALFYDALHHAEDEAAAVRGAFAALRPGGVCVAVEPGEGHAASAGARHAVEAFGVTEKDMPPGRVVEVGRAAGFRRFRVFARSIGPTLLREFEAADLPAALAAEAPPGPPPADAFRASNVVWMQK